MIVDPSSPFNLGALLGDRIRMSEWYNHPNVLSAHWHPGDYLADCIPGLLRSMIL
ncbi:MAG: hypothetical protein ABI813_11235 [Bacteroidota bacterium]